MRARRQYSAWLLLGATAPLVCGLHNAIYYERPPMGWRSWNVFNADVTQELMQSVMDAAVRQRIGLDGKSISLAELGYVNIGLDDGWQACNAGVRGSFHDARGKPLINTERFPDLRRMTAYGHDKGLRVGFYANNCICGEVGPTGSDGADAILEHYVEDVRMIVDHGFDGVKVDACGQYLDMRLWARLLNETGRQVLLENCHWGMCADVNDDGISGEGVAMHDWTEGNSGCPSKLPDGKIDCPFHVFRTSGDIDGSAFSWLRNLESTVRFLDRDLPLAGRGCWAYPDMLEVGNMEDGVTFEWEQAHFGAWLIMSSPLILGFDLRNDAIVGRLWPFLANKEAIAVSQTWQNHPGWRVKSWTPDDKVGLRYKRRPIDTENVHTALEDIDLLQVWTKPLKGGSHAVFILNGDSSPGAQAYEYSLSLRELGMPEAATVLVRDIWTRKDRGIAQPTRVGEEAPRTSVKGSVKGMSSEFILLTPTKASPPFYPPPPPPLPRPLLPTHKPSPMPPVPVRLNSPAPPLTFRERAPDAFDEMSSQSDPTPSPTPVPSDSTLSLSVLVTLCVAACGALAGCLKWRETRPRASNVIRPIRPSWSRPGRGIKTSSSKSRDKYRPANHRGKYERANAEEDALYDSADEVDSRSDDMLDESLREREHRPCSSTSAACASESHRSSKEKRNSRSYTDRPPL